MLTHNTIVRNAFGQNRACTYLDIVSDIDATYDNTIGTNIHMIPVSVQKCTKPFKDGHSEKPAIYGFH